MCTHRALRPCRCGGRLALPFCVFLSPFSRGGRGGSQGRTLPPSAVCCSSLFSFWRAYAHCCRRLGYARCGARAARGLQGQRRLSRCALSGTHTHTATDTHPYLYLYRYTPALRARRSQPRPGIVMGDRVDWRATAPFQGLCASRVRSSQGGRGDGRLCGMSACPLTRLCVPLFPPSPRTDVFAATRLTRERGL